jgi:hypothetical protein
LQQATGCGAKVVRVNNKRELALPRREVRAHPTEGALVRSVSAALTRRRSQRAWRGVALRVASLLRRAGGRSSGCSKARVKEPVALRRRRATQGVRGSHIRPGFLSRWAQEVDSRWQVLTGTAMLRRDAAG